MKMKYKNRELEKLHDKWWYEMCKSYKPKSEDDIDWKEYEIDIVN